MIVYILARPRNIWVDNSEFPGDLDFSQVDDELRFEIYTADTGRPDSVRPLVAIDLTGVEGGRGWVIEQLLNELNRQSRQPGYEEIIRNTSRPLIGFGRCRLDADSFMF